MNRGIPGYRCLSRADLQLLRLTEPPDAIFTSNSLLAAGGVCALREHEIVVPDDIAFASFDEPPWFGEERCTSQTSSPL
ncbi:MAG: substrate-binding domain-containing protein [Desulfosarcinaceae bacterium]|jgi:DNA-binding LacI/PurR family transcriptional regulator